MNINNHRNLYPEYSKKLSDMLISGALKIKLDFGSTSKEGPFIGIQSVVRAVEVNGIILYSINHYYTEGMTNYLKMKNEAISN